ncbi:MAG: PEP-CTERM sorting domain-containing protein [Verrucomicrobiota bacterium]
MKSLPKILAATIAATLFAGASNLSDSLLFSDDFTANGGGTGWAGGSVWDGAAAFSGGEISHSGESFRTMATPITLATMDFWMATEMRLSGDSSSWGAITFFNGTDAGVYFGTDSASTDWEFGNGGVFSDQNTGIPSFNQGSNAFLLAHITTNTVDLWVNPGDTSSIAALGVANASITNSPLDPAATWNRIGIRSTATVTITVDSLIAATTFNEVVGVPEPSTVISMSAFGAIGGFVFFARRRKQKRAASAATG